LEPFEREDLAALDALLAALRGESLSLGERGGAEAGHEGLQQVIGDVTY
jgi:hypothetical protein